MTGLIALLVLAAVAIAVAAAIAFLLVRPMRALLSSNAHLAPAESFYLRAFALTVMLGALAAVVGRSMPSPEKGKSMTAMEYVWWVVGGLEPAFLSIALFLMGYVVLLTILFAVLGRYRDV